MLNLQHLKDLEAKATKGQWKTGMGREESMKIWAEGKKQIAFLSWDFTPPQFDENAELIVALRNAFPAIVEEVERLREIEVASVGQAFGLLALESKIDRLRAENEDLSGDVKYKNGLLDKYEARESQWRAFAKKHNLEPI